MSHAMIIVGMTTHGWLEASSTSSYSESHTWATCALSHEKSHAVNLIGMLEIRTAVSANPKNRSMYTRPSSLLENGVRVQRDYSMRGEHRSTERERPYLHQLLYLWVRRK